MSDVFISYRRSDRAIAEALYRALKEEGLDIWWDASLQAGETFDEKIQSILQSSKAIILLWSPEAAESEWVRGEGTIGRERGVLVPKRIVYNVHDKCAQLLSLLGSGGPRPLRELYEMSGSRSEVVATFLSVLELCSAGTLLVREGENGLTVSLAEGAELRVPDFETPDEAPDSGDLQ